MRIALVADTHLAARAPECVANWHAARRAVQRLGVDLTINLGDVTLDGQTHPEDLPFASQLLRQWPGETRCVPGNHDLGDGSGDEPLDLGLLAAYEAAFGPDRWAVGAGAWKLLGINAQLLGTGSAQEAALWDWIAAQAAASPGHAHTALFLHRPLLRPASGEPPRPRRHVPQAATQRLLQGPLAATLRLVVSGHVHQYLDAVAEGVRHLWMPSCAFILPDTMQPRVGEKLVGIGLLELEGDEARFDLWCPQGMVRHDVSGLGFFRAMAG